MVPAVLSVIPLFLLDIFNAEALLGYGGLLIAFLLVYGTTGLFFCFFIPSGGVLFAAGMLAATGSFDHNLFIILIVLIAACVSGNLTGYWIGRKAGPLLYQKEDSRFFRKDHLKAAEAFYKKYGKWALTIGLYIPVVRTFVSAVAGIIRMNFRSYFLLICIGSVLWVTGIVMLGYLVGAVPFLKKWSTYIIIGFLLMVTTPILIRVVREFRAFKKEHEQKQQ
jgi:membrane-associated protein